ncbi:tetratricopeptide repeat protein [uncultured Methanobrevibacter sp.]|uniref:tetratricopeptide repeat protein n=1 Tax=uncultured Methanobrevibacter sp. TaxID=253161 RepID=UPI00262A3AA1|nr:tetratricopeptide repeat protein [uncultured Methanobrevibacter sp.]
MLEEYIESKIDEAYYYMQNDTDVALKIFDDILEIEPDNITALNGKGSSLMKLNRLNEAKDQFNQSLAIEKNSSAFLNKGIIFKQEKNYTEAISNYDKAYNLNPKLENIINILKDEITCKKDLTYFNNEAEELIQKGIDLKGENKLWDARDAFTKAIETDPSCRRQAEKSIEEIKTIFQKELLYKNCKLNPEKKIDRIKIQAKRAVAEENDLEKTLTLMNLVLELDENDINTLNNKGRVLFMCDEYQKALECFDGCLNINENYYCALFNRAFVLRAMNRLPEAMECFEKLLKTPQNHEKIKPYQEEIREKLRKGADK